MAALVRIPGVQNEAGGGAFLLPCTPQLGPCAFSTQVSAAGQRTQLNPCPHANQSLPSSGANMRTSGCLPLPPQQAAVAAAERL